MGPTLSLALGLLLAVMCSQINTGLAIGCFTCSSFNASDPMCSDPFSPAIGVYKPHCRQGKDGRIGMFPARYCMKMNGVSLSRGIEVVVRSCTLENMYEQCGIFELEDERFRGCLSTCTRDACNSATYLQTVAWSLLLAVVMAAGFCWN